MKALFLRNQINIISLLSSTTYKTDFFDKCIYCHKDIENDFYEYKGENIGMTYRCKCEKAKEELESKKQLLEKLMNLQRDIDVKTINKVTKQAIINEFERAYEEDCEGVLLSIVDSLK